MMQPFCEKVFISCNDKQAITIMHGYNVLTDDPAFHNIGPMAALITAFTHFSKKNFLLTGCDYPFLTATGLSDFLSSCKTEKMAVAFYNEQEDMYEPLLAWYPYTAFNSLKKMHEANQYSLQQYLRENPALKYYPAHKNCIKSIDTPAPE